MRINIRLLQVFKPHYAYWRIYKIRLDALEQSYIKSRQDHIIGRDSSTNCLSYKVDAVTCLHVFDPHHSINMRFIMLVGSVCRTRLLSFPRTKHDEEQVQEIIGHVFLTS